MDKFAKEIPVPKENVKNTNKESRQPLNTLLDLDPNIAHSSNTRFVAVSGSENSHGNFKVVNDNETTEDKVNVAISREATPSTLPRVSCNSTDICTYRRDILTYLLEKEEKTPCPTFCNSEKCRAYHLDLITKINQGKGDPAVVQTTAWYFDMLMTQQRVVSEHLLLVITACFWIAMKIHGRGCKAQVLVKLTGYKFNAAELVSAEMEILLLLNCPPQPIVPQEFIGYLVSCCDIEQSKTVMFQCATFICTNAININLKMADEYPSVVAVAAVKTTLLLLKKQHFAKKLEAYFVYSAASAKGEIIDVCVSQIYALQTFFADQFKFTATKIILKDYDNILGDLEREVNYLFNTGGEGIIRWFLME